MDGKLRKVISVLIVISVSMINHLKSEVSDSNSDRLIILHTNDTHSRIDPDTDNKGGILRRAVVIDSFRAVEPNVLLVDAGDAVQGTLYYSLFGGEVERELMNTLGYDIQILGNHEFDNGLDALVREWSRVNAIKLSTNYDMTESPLDSIIKPYTIKEYGDKKIGFIAINVDPDGIISAYNCKGVKYMDGLKAANSTAWHLKHNEKVDLVVAITHIGYASSPGYVDLDLAANSEDIDIIIGGHSHTLLNPADPASQPSKVLNNSGDTVLIAQAGSAGHYIGVINVDLKTMNASSRVMPIDSRYDGKIDPDKAAVIEPYRNKVDSILGLKIGYAESPVIKENFGLINLISDIVKAIGDTIYGGKVDMAIMNKGGIRCDMPAGDITKGEIMQMLPFDNRVVVLEVSGKDLAEAFTVMARRNGDGIDGRVFAPIDTNTLNCKEIMINGTPLDENKIYILATIDYLATGGDFLQSLKNGKEIGRSKNILYDDVIWFLSEGPLKDKQLQADTELRMPLINERK